MLTSGETLSISIQGRIQACGSRPIHHSRTALKRQFRMFPGDYFSRMGINDERAVCHHQECSDMARV